MATRHIYETDFDEDVSNDNTPCPECGGQVRTNTVETVCEDCGLVIDEQKIDHGPEWRSFEDDEETPNRTGAPLTVARHDRGLSTKIGRRKDANGNELSGQKRQRLLECAVNRLVVGSSRKLNETSHTAWVRSEES